MHSLKSQDNKVDWPLGNTFLTEIFRRVWYVRSAKQILFSNMTKQELLIGLVAAIVGLSALLFAVFQAVAAFAQLMGPLSRCDKRVTGSFGLNAGIWFSFSTLTPNVKYRMPVITMPGLRLRIPVMGPGSMPEEFRPGLNFRKNGYVDGRYVRVQGKFSSKAPINARRTVFLFLRNIIWAPLAVTFSTVTCLVCPCTLCCPCGGPGILVIPLSPLMHWISRDKNGKDIEINTGWSVNPNLECASWAQFLYVHQLAWWGHANVHWEWRLASSVPLDIPAATVETTVADLELLALMFGMVLVGQPDVLARSMCGEEIIMSRHPSVGRLAFFHSGRENIRSRILLSEPETSSAWLHLNIQSLQRRKNDFYTPVHQLPEVLDSLGYAIPNVQVERILDLLARRRTTYDAQLQFSCGDAGWIFSSLGFLRAAAGMWQLPGSQFEITRARTSLGPLGKGTNSCSCMSYFRSWSEHDPDHNNRF